MTRAGSDRPLQKVTMNHYRDNIAYLVSVYGTGWTIEIRRIVDEYVTHRRKAIKEIEEGLSDG